MSHHRPTPGTLQEIIPGTVTELTAEGYCEGCGLLHQILKTHRIPVSAPRTAPNPPQLFQQLSRDPVPFFLFAWELRAKLASCLFSWVHKTLNMNLGH